MNSAGFRRAVCCGWVRRSMLVGYKGGQIEIG